MSVVTVSPNGFFAPAIEDAAELIVPTLSLYEVFKRVLQQRADFEHLPHVRFRPAASRR